MIRSVAALFAKKTAIVAIAGVTVIGGATFALAEATAPPAEESSDSTAVADAPLVEGDCGEGTTPNTETNTCDTLLVEGDCGEGTTLNTETNTCDTLLVEGDCGEGTTLNTETNTCDASVSDDPAECDPALLAEDETCPDAEGDAGDEDAAEHPENHGKYVSEAAKGGGECAGLSGRDKGQCVAGVARSDIGKNGAEESAPADEPAAEDTTSEDPAPETQTMTAPAEEPAKGKPAHAGGNGKGKGGKG